MTRPECSNCSAPLNLGKRRGYVPPSRGAYRIEVHAPRPAGRVAYAYPKVAESGRLVWLVTHVDGRGRIVGSRAEAVEAMLAYADTTHPAPEGGGQS